MALALLATARAADGNATRTYLDSIARMVDGGVEGMDAALWASIEACMKDVDGGRLLAASDAAWRGLGHYDNPADPWGSCNASTGCKEYKEMNETRLDVSGVLVYEPCNTVSNAAYYRTAANLCDGTSDMSRGDRDAVVAAVAHMAYGSSFWHGSHTRLGNVADNGLIQVIAYADYQVMVRHLVGGGNATRDRVLLSLSSSRDRPSAADAARGLTDLFLTRPVDEWTDYIAAIDVPDYFTTFAAIVLELLTLVAPNSPHLVDEIVQIGARAFNLSDAVVAFMTEELLPAQRAAVAELPSPPSALERAGLACKFVGTMLKLGYAFLWQENFFPWSRIYGVATNDLGAALMPGLNRVANLVTGFKHADADQQRCERVYAADDRCRKLDVAPHAKWHESSANGLLDLALLADDVHKLTSTKARAASPLGRFAAPFADGWAALFLAA